MNQDEAIMLATGARLVDRLQQEATERVLAALTGVLVVTEVPALLSGLHDALTAAQSETPALLKRSEEAARVVAGEEAAHAQLVSEMKAIPDIPTRRREHAAAVVAVKDGELALRDAETDRRSAERHLKDNQHRCYLLGEKIAALEAMPAPDPAVLSAIRG